MPLKIGVNPSDALHYYSSHQPFLDRTKQAALVATFSNGHQYVDRDDISAVLTLDANGYPTSMIGIGAEASATCTSFLFKFCADIPLDPDGNRYDSGTYVLLYDGTGSFSYANDIGLQAGGNGAGRKILAVTPSATGSYVYLTSTGAGVNYCRNIRIVYSADSTTGVVGAEEQRLLDGEYYSQQYLDQMAPFSVIRFLDWDGGSTDDGVTWDTRTTPDSITWSPCPHEVMIDLCNQKNADYWITFTARVNDDYFKQQAELVESTLNSNLLRYFEYYNEIWQYNFQSQGTWLQARGLEHFTAEDYSAGLWECLARTARMGSIVKQYCTGARTVINCQNANVGTTGTFLNATAAFQTGKSASFTASQSGTTLSVSGVVGNLVVGQEIRGGTITEKTTYLQEDLGGGHWRVNISQTVATASATAAMWYGQLSGYIDTVSTAPYFGSRYGMPVAWGGDADGGIAKLTAEIQTGGQLPILTSPSASSGQHTHTTGGTTTAYTVSTSGDTDFGNGAIPSTPDNGQAIRVQFHATNTWNTATVTFDGTTNKVNWTAHGMPNGTQVAFKTTGALPTGLTIVNQEFGAIYFIVNAGTNDFQLAASVGGSAIDFTGAGTGTHTGYNFRVTLAVDGGTPYPIFDSVGHQFSTYGYWELHDGSYQWMQGSGVLVFTSKTINGNTDAALTGWYRMWGDSPTALGQIGDEMASLDEHIALAVAADKEFCCYEGGQHYFANSVFTQTTDYHLMFLGLNRATEMYDVYTDYLERIEAKTDITNFCHYVDIGVSSIFGYWGLLETSVATSSPKYDAISDFSATLPGNDFKVVLFRISREGGAEITIDLSSLPDGTVGTSYSQAVTASGGADPYTFAVTSGALPTGLSLNSSSGAVTGTPTVNDTFDFTITATDADTNTGTRDYTLVISADTVNLDDTLPDGTANTAYTGAVTASNGTSPYTYAVTSGSLPTGLSLSAGGALTGTPSVANTFNFTVTATDAYNQTGNRAYSVVIASAPVASSATPTPTGGWGGGLHGRGKPPKKFTAGQPTTLSSLDKPLFTPEQVQVQPAQVQKKNHALGPDPKLVQVAIDNLQKQLDIKRRRKQDDDFIMFG